MNALRRQEEEEERRPGINLGRGRGVISRFRNWERVPGRENNSMFMGRSRSFPVPPQTDTIRKQPHTWPHCLTSGFEYVAPNSHFPQRNQPPVPPYFYLALSLPKLLSLSSITTTPTLSQEWYRKYLLRVFLTLRMGAHT